MCLVRECLGVSVPALLFSWMPGCICVCLRVGVGAAGGVCAVQSNKGTDKWVDGCEGGKVLCVAVSGRLGVCTVVC